MAKDYEINALSALRRNPQDAEAWSQWGVGLFIEAKDLPSAVALPLLEEASRKFTAATNLVPHEAQYWFNLAAATQSRAFHEPPSESAKLFTVACEHFEKAARNKPQWYAPWQSWGITLSILGQTEKDRDRAFHFLQQANIRFAVGDELKPGVIAILELWGINLQVEAKFATADEALPLWRMSGDLFAKIVQIDQKNSQAWGRWGACQFNQAILSQDENQSSALLDSAIRKLEIATQFAPQESFHWHYYGHSLRSKANLSKGNEKRHLLAESSKYFEKAIQANPDDAHEWASWADVLFLEANCLPEPECQHFYHEAALRLSVASEITPEHDYIWINWGITLSIHALYCPSSQAIPLLDKSLLMMDRAQELNPKSSVMYGHRSFALLHRSHYLIGEEKAKFLQDAASSAEQETVLYPESFTGWYYWAMVLLEYAVHSSGDQRTEYLASASEKIDRAEAAKEHSSTYVQAALAALQGDSAQCHAWLILSEENDNLNSKRYLRRDEAFASVRDEEWFCQILERMPR